MSRADRTRRGPVCGQPPAHSSLLSLRGALRGAALAFRGGVRGGVRRLRPPRRYRKLLVAAAALAALAIVALPGALAATGTTFTVNDTADRIDVNVGNGTCETTAGTCSLRAAIMESNATSGRDTIAMQSGVYELEIPQVNDDLPGTGDIDITATVIIKKKTPSANVIIDGGFPLEGSTLEQPGLDRIFEIHPNAGAVTIQGDDVGNITMREGFSVDDGGAIQNWSKGTLRIEHVTFHRNYAQAGGGAINHADPTQYDWAIEPLVPPRAGRVDIVDSKFTRNYAGGGGAAINNSAAGTITVLRTEITDNPGPMIDDPTFVPDPTNPHEPIPQVPAPGVFEPDSSAIENQAEFDSIGTIKITDSLIARNTSDQDGAGVKNAGSGTLILESTDVLDNVTDANGGGVFSAGGTLTIAGGDISRNVAHSAGGGIATEGEPDKVGLRGTITITGTRVADNHSGADGGGIATDGDSKITFTDVAALNNLAADAGGGIAIEGRSSFVGTRITASGNKTPGEGGGIYLESERLGILHDPLVTNNEAGIKDPLDIMTIGNPGEKGYVPGSNTAGGGGMYTEGGPVQIYGGEFSGNIATEEGGGISLDNFGAARIQDTLIQGNKAGADGGGIENSGMRVTFDHIRVKGNSATLDGGGIYNSSSGDFLVIDWTMEKNTATNGGGFANAPDADLIIRQSTILANTARFPGFDDAQQQLEGGEGGGFWSKADGDALLENNTITGNFAAVRGGGLYHDADGLLHLVNLTITRNSAPVGGGIGVVESDFAPEVPPKANESVVLRNTIIAESIRGGSCDWYVTSEGGNLSDAGVKAPPTTFSDTPPPPAVASCFTTPPPGSDMSHMEGLRDRQGDPNLDAIADNGGATLTHRVTFDSLAVNQGVFPCPETDQRGVARPQWEKCDVGAFEYDGSEEPPIDTEPPDTEYVSGPIPDTLETVAFRFTGSDDKTPVDELQYECRLVEHDPTEQVELIAPWEPIPPELQWVTCSNPYTVPPAEESMFTFEVRAIDRAGNIDPTPDVHAFSGEDTVAPQTIIVEHPSNPSFSRTGTFSFTATDNMTPPQFMEYECRIDTRDPDLWVECFNPAIFSNLTTGMHTVEVRATDLGEMVDPTPARYTWMVSEPQNCDAANITLTAIGDGMINQKESWENYVFLTDLTVASEGIGDPTEIPPEPIIGENSRALFRFNLPNDAPNCELQRAELQLWNESPTEGRNIDATPLVNEGQFLESTLTWDNQPDVIDGAEPVTIGVTTDTPRYMKWNVIDHVNAAIDAEQNGIGWRISDAVESDPEGTDQTFTSREAPIDPPEMTLPRLMLIYDTDSVPAPPAPTIDPGRAEHRDRVRHGHQGGHDPRQGPRGLPG